MRIKPIETQYGGVTFKSRLEADMAFMFDKLGQEWIYEPVSYLLDNGRHYQPDFWLPKMKLFSEGRGDPLRTEDIKAFRRIINAGRIDSDLKLYSHPNELSINESPKYLVIQSDQPGWINYRSDDGSAADSEYAEITRCTGCGQYTIFGLFDHEQCLLCGGKIAKEARFGRSIGIGYGKLEVNHRPVSEWRDFSLFWKEGVLISDARSVWRYFRDCPSIEIASPYGSSVFSHEGVEDKIIIWDEDYDHRIFRLLEDWVKNRPELYKNFGAVSESEGCLTVWSSRPEYFDEDPYFLVKDGDCGDSWTTSLYGVTPKGISGYWPRRWQDTDWCKIKTDKLSDEARESKEG